MRIEQLSLEAWDEALPDAGFGVFHVPAALDVLGRHAEGELRLYGGFKGDEPVGLFPAFVRDATVGRTVASPPPGFGVPQLGPLVMPTSPKQRKRERVNRTFAESVLETLDVDDRFTLFRTVCPVGFSDPRPYTWAGLSVSTAYTYRLDVGAGADETFARFSKSLRREIRDARDVDVTVAVEGRDGVRAVFEQTRARYAEQDRGFTMDWDYVDALVDGLAAEDRARAYVARDRRGEFLGGVVALFSNDAAYYWLGGARTDHEGVSVNSLVHWRIIEDVATDPPIESVTAYDLVGANTERLCRYKSKFGADLVPHYVVESAGPGMGVAKAAYRMVRR